MLKGTHISLRAAELRDAARIYEWENDPEHWLVSNMSAPMSMHQIEQFLQNDNDVFIHRQMRLMIDDLQNNVVGCVDLFDFDPKNHHIGVGILIDRGYRGHHYGNEAVSLACSYCFEMLEVKCIYADVPDTNEASMRLFEKLGFERTGTRKQWLWSGKGYVDLHFYQKIC